MTNPIRFYGRRKGRALSQYQQALLAEMLPQLSVTTDTFKANKLYLEIGFGGGEHLAHQASLFPETTFIGCEPFLNGVVSLLTHIRQGTQSNIRIFHGDVRLLLSELPDAVLDKVFILYPDPWPKARHGKRRIIQVEFIRALLPKLKPNAKLIIATDDEAYAEHIKAVFAQSPEFIGDTSSIPPDNWVRTRYEARAKRLGNTSYYFIFDKLSIVC